MAHERVEADSFELSHAFLAQMLGTRRPSVTAALGRLQRGGGIDYTRGRLSVRDRARLAAASCPCYGVIRGEFDRLLPGSFAVPAATT